MSIYHTPTILLYISSWCEAKGVRIVAHKERQKRCSSNKHDDKKTTAVSRTIHIETKLPNGRLGRERGASVIIIIMNVVANTSEPTTDLHCRHPLRTAHDDKDNEAGLLLPLPDKENISRPHHRSTTSHHHHRSKLLWFAVLALTIIIYSTHYSVFLGRHDVVSQSQPHPNPLAWLHGNSTSTLGETRKPHVEFFDPQESCTLFESTTAEMKYLGCGYNGQVFATNLQCLKHNRRPKVDDHQRQRSIVVKLLTFPANKTDTKKFINGRIGTYKSDTAETEQKHKALHARLLARRNDTKSSKVLQHFAIPLGGVDVPLTLIRRAMESANHSLSMGSPYRGMVYPVPEYDHRNSNNNDQSIRGQVFTRLPSDAQTLRSVMDNKQQPISTSQRQSMVRDLIWIYRHMFHQNVLVCDIKMDHFLYSPSTDTTTLIDFDSVRFTIDQETPSGSQHNNNNNQRLGLYARQWQLWQLLVMIAQVCDTEGLQQVQTQRLAADRGLLSPAGLASIVCGARGGNASLWRQAKSVFANALRQCQFGRGDDSEEVIHWEAFENEQADRIHEIYKSMVHWSGLQ
eukprot:scaffold7405_cov204-Amphora_coffeaeformis.AAC.15